jgi:hypothetical protein
MLPPSPCWSPSQGRSSWSGNSVDSLQAFLMCKSGSSRWPLLDLSQLFSLSSFQPNHRRPLSLRYTVAATPQIQLMWSHKTTCPFDIQRWCTQSPSEQELCKPRSLTRPKPRASAFSSGLTSLSTSQSTYTNHLVISLSTMVARALE